MVAELTFLRTSQLKPMFLIQENGANYEANQRCNVFMNDTTFQSYGYTFDTCKPKMKTQLLWTTIGLYVIYMIASGFGIHIIKNAEDHLVLRHQQYIQQKEEEYYDDDNEDNISDLDEQGIIPNYGSNDIMMDNKKDK